MAASQEHITPDMPFGATLVPGGAVFKAYAPGADAVHVALLGPGHTTKEQWAPSQENLLEKDKNGYWTGFFQGVKDGAMYRFWTKGPGGSGFKRDPQARELELHGYPDVDCIIRGENSYPWHDRDFVAPHFNDLIIYQLHIGTFYASDGERDIRYNRVCKFLDVVDRLEYLVDLGINAIQPLPVVEWQSVHSRGYNNTDFFSPEMDYALALEDLEPYLDRVNSLLRKKGKEELQAKHLYTQVNQLKAMIDLFHIYGIAVILDVVYNHAGDPLDKESLRFFDQPLNQDGKAPDLYFQGGEGWAGGRVFDFKKQEVRDFLIDNSKYFIDEYHVDGFRYDEVSVICDFGGKEFCKELTDRLRKHAPEVLLIAEYWYWDRAFPVTPTPNGLGFDAAVHDGLRDKVRDAIGAASKEKSSFVNMTAVRDSLFRPAGFPDSWRAVVHVENHDIVDGDRPQHELKPRIPTLADATNSHSWYARSRSRVATGLIMTAPGIPMLFMGQEFMEDKLWHNSPLEADQFIYWEGLTNNGTMRDFFRFTKELCELRRRLPALRGEGVGSCFVHDTDRVLAFHRWVEGAGREVMVIVSLNESVLWDYSVAFPVGGYWHEVFNSDAFDSMSSGGGYNPNVVGNHGGLMADGPPLQSCPYSARVVIPANGLLVFSRDLDD